MHVHLRRSIAATLLAAAAAFTSASCARDDSSIFIRGVVVVTRTDCSFQVSLTPTLQLQGSIDAAYAGEYRATLIVENQLVARGNPVTLKTETSGVQLYEAEVQVLDPSQGNGAITRYSVPITGFVDPSLSGSAGVGASEVLMVDAATITKLAANVASTGIVQEVVSSVILKGRTLGGLEVHTQEFLYPISVFFNTTCTQPAGMACIRAMSTTATVDCRIGLDEATNCVNIASSLGACGKLECPLTMLGKSDLLNSHCPAHVPADKSCCNP